MAQLLQIATVAGLISAVLSVQTPVSPEADSNTERTSSSGCSTCSNGRSRQRTPQEMQRDKLQFEQDKILSKLRLQKPPNVHVSMSDLPSPLLRRLKADNEEFDKNNANSDSFYVRTHYSNLHNDEHGADRRQSEAEQGYDADDPLIAKTKDVYIFSQRPKTGDTHTFNCLDINGRIAGCLEFQLNSELFSRQISSASLWLYKTVGDRTDNNRTFEITEIQRNRQHDAAYSELWVADVPVTEGSDGWMEIDLTERVTRWHRPTNGEANDRNRRLRVACSGCANTPRAPLALSHSRKPFLEVKLGKKIASQSNQGRNRRNSNECMPHLYSNCCLKPFYVNFTEIGWHSWILQPPGYYANYCTGSCRTISTTSYNSILRNVGTTKEARGEVVDQELVPCCAPTKMTALSLLYAFSPGEIMKQTLDNMIVESCGC